MRPENSASPTTELDARVSLLRAASAGQLDRLACPRCGASAVSVWFTRPTPNDYRTWFGCAKCDFEMSAQNSSRPAFYSEARDRTARVPAAGD
jgi:hypothetical protein